MAATVYFQEWNGTSGSEVATSKIAETIQFKSEDTPGVETTISATAPLIKPVAGVYRSYEKYIQLYLEALNGATDISNLEVFVAGTTSEVDGIGIFVKVTDTYATPLAGGYDAAGAMIGPKEDLFDKTSDAPLELGAGPFNTELDNCGDYLVLQMEVYPSGSTGETQNFATVVRWDES